MSNAEAKAQAQAQATAMVDIAGLHKSYGNHEVLKGIDLKVMPGEVIAIIGKSGSGKSTLLRCINGLEEFQQGTLTVDGKPLLYKNANAMRELRQHVGMIFQSFNLFPHLSVGKNIMLAPGLVKRRIKPAVRRMPASCSNVWAWPKNLMPTRTNSQVVNSSGWPSPVPWPWSLRCCCVTRSPVPWTLNWWAKCCVWWRHWQTRA